MTVVKKPLTDIEKLAIEKLVENNVSVKEITTKLNRSPNSKAVKRYVDKCQQQTVSINNQPSQVQEFYNQAVNRMVKNGIPIHMASEMVRKAIGRFKSENKEIETAEQLKEDAISHIGAGDLIGFTSDGGDRGVAVMTEAATQRADDARKNYRSNKNPEHIFKPKG